MRKIIEIGIKLRKNLKYILGFLSNLYPFCLILFSFLSFLIFSFCLFSSFLFLLGLFILINSGLFKNFKLLFWLPLVLFEESFKGILDLDKVELFDWSVWFVETCLWINFLLLPILFEFMNKLKFKGEFFWFIKILVLFFIGVVLSSSYFFFSVEFIFSNKIVLFKFILEIPCLFLNWFVCSKIIDCLFDSIIFLIFEEKQDDSFCFCFSSFSKIFISSIFKKLFLSNLVFEIKDLIFIILIFSICSVNIILNISSSSLSSLIIKLSKINNESPSE